MRIGGKILKAAVCLVLCLFGWSCDGSMADESFDPMGKIEFDLDLIDEDGLRGLAGGKVAVSYEFAIPDRDECRAEVKAIDSSVQFMCGSRGRVGAGKDECLCIGMTHQDNYRDVLWGLARLGYVERIIECHFE